NTMFRLILLAITTLGMTHIIGADLMTHGMVVLGVIRGDTTLLVGAGTSVLAGIMAVIGEIRMLGVIRITVGVILTMVLVGVIRIMVITADGVIHIMATVGVTVMAAITVMATATIITNPVTPRLVRVSLIIIREEMFRAELCRATEKQTKQPEVIRIW